MDFNKLSTGDKVLAGSGIALLIFSFLPWYTAKAKGGLGVGSASSSNNGWDYFLTGIVPVLLALVLVGYVVVTKLLDGTKLPDMPVGWPIVVLGVAGLAALLVILRLIVGSGEDVPSYAKDLVDISRGFGLFLSVVASLGLAGGAFLKFQEDGGDFSNIKKGTSSGSGDAGQGGAPTPF